MYGHINNASAAAFVNGLPFNAQWDYNYSQQIYLSTEISGAGVSPGAITQIKFYWNFGSSSTTWNDLDIYLGNTTQSSYNSTNDWIPISAMTLVHSGAVSSLPSSAPGFLTISLPTPFVYTGQNLVIAINEKKPGSSTSQSWSSFSYSGARSISALSGGVINPTSPPTNNVTLGGSNNQLWLQAEFLAACPSLNSPPDTASNISTSPTLSWSSGQYTANYDLYLSTSQIDVNNLAASAKVASNQLGTSFTASGLQGGTDYFWKVVPKNSVAVATTNCNARKFTTAPIPTQPTINYPINQAINIPVSQTFSWTAGLNTSYYDVYLSTNQADVINQVAGALVSSNQIGTSFSPYILQGGTVYYWCIVPKNSIGIAGASSTIYSFTTAIPPAPSCPNLVSPLNSASNQSISTTLNWTPGSTTSHYDVYLSASQADVTNHAVGALVSSNQIGTSYSPIGLQNGTSYYWKVVPKYGGSTATGCVIYQFTTGTPPTISTPANQSFSCAGSYGPITITLGDNETLLQNLVVTATSSNTTLLPNSNITLTSPTSGGIVNLSYSAITGSSGSTTITLTVTDQQGFSATSSFQITITSQTSAPTVASQSLCSGATVADLVATGNSIQWYNTASGGTALANSTALTSSTYYASQTVNGCESSRTPVAVTINNTTAPSASSQTFCSGATVADLVATGTSIQWYSAATGGSALAASTTLSNATYYASQTVNGCESSRTSVAVTINTIQSLIVPSTQTFCVTSSASAQLTLINYSGNLAGATIKRYSVPTGGTVLPSNNVMNDGNTYYLSQTVNGCESSRAATTVTININPAAPTASSQTFCSGATVANLVATGTNIQWYNATTGGSPLSTSTTLSGVTYYVSQTSSNSCESSRTPVAVTINTTNPPSVGLSTQPTCTNATGSVDLTNLPSGVPWTINAVNISNGLTVHTLSGSGTTTTFSGLNGGITYKFNVLNSSTSCTSGNSTGSAIINMSPVPPTPTISSITQPTCVTPTGSIVVTGWNTGMITVNCSNGTSYTGSSASHTINSLAANQNYTISVTQNGCTSSPQSVTINPVPSASAPTTTPQTLCPGATVADLVATGTSIQWYSAATGGSALAASTTLSNATYYASQTVNGCVSSRTSANVTLLTAPSAPTAATPQSFCSGIGATVANLVATGTNIQWYNAPTGGSALALNTLLSDALPYYASQTSNGCASPRTLVSVSFNSIPNPPTASSTQTFCSGATVGNLVASASPGNAIKWYSVANGGTQLSNSTALSSGTYYVSQTSSSGCESSRTSINVTINSNSAPAAPTATTPQIFCYGATVGNIVATGTNIKWYPSPTTTSSIPTSQVIPGSLTLYASQTVNGCESSRTPVALTINNTTAPSASSQTFCSGATVADLVATGTSIQWYSAATGGSALAASTTLSNATYYASQTVNGCESSRTSVSATLNPVPAPPTATSQTLSSGATVINLVASGTAIQWYNAASGGTALANSTALTSSTYYASQTVNGCESSRTSVVVTINSIIPSPNISVQPTPQTVCNNSTLSLSVTASPYASGTLSYQWRKNGVAISGATSSVYTKNNFSAADEGTYDVVISEAGNSYQATSNGVAVALSPITWNGNANSQSNNSSNWLCGTQPTATSNVEFIASPGNVMQLQNDLEINNLNIGNAANSIIDLNAKTLKINGAISGTLKIKGGASAKLIIAGANSKTIYFPTQNDAKLGHLKIDHPSADITLDGDVEIYDSLVINQGNLNINGLVTLKTTSCSGANATTSVAQIGRFNGSSLTYLSAGKVRVERCFPADRSYRTVTSPVTTTTSMWDNWQEAGVYAAGYGTLITGSNLGFGANSGIDNNQTGIPSIYKYNNQTQAWANITTGTKNITLQAGEPYLLMVRGDRNPQTVTSNTATANNTILRATGTLVSGDFTYTSTTTVNGVQLAALNNQYSLVGNPYASKIVWDSIYNNSTNISENIWIWDPHKNGTSAMGAYSSYNKTSGGIAGEQINKYIQPWQSFFVKNTADAPILRLKDPFKQLDGTTARTFKTTSNFDAKLSVKLFLKQQADSGYHSDALLIAMDEQFENTKGKGDCDKFMNIDESIYMLSSDSTKLSIGSFKTPQSVSFDTIQLYTSNLKSNQYVLRFNSSDITDPSLKMYILDRYQNSIQAINNNGTTDLDFTITSDPLSSSNKRWFIIYNKLAAPTAISNLQVSTIKIVPNPANNVIKVFIPSTEVSVVKATVVDIFGKQQQVQYLQTNEYNEMDITALAPGIYMLQTNNGNRVEQTKFIKL